MALGPSRNDEDSGASIGTAAELYRIYSPVLQQALSLLMSQDLSERKAVVVYDMGLHAPRAFREAVSTILLENAALRAVSFQPALEMAAFSVHLPSVLMVYFSHSCEAHCVAFSSHQVLEYTYQACGCVGRSDDRDGGRSKQKQRQQQFVKDKVEAISRMLDVDSPNSVAVAVLKCLEACPRAARKEIVGNMLVAGDVAFMPNLGVRIARQVRACLRGGGGGETPEEESLPAKEGEGGSTPGESQQPAFRDRVVAETTTTRVPVRTSELRSLAEFVGLVEPAQIRPDLLAWVGASVWSSYWHGIDPESSCFQWTKRKGQ